MQRPTAPPMIPASASGVSTQRSGPNRSRKPAVARKTPPARPTSSPMTRTVSSRSISTWSASLTASTRNFSAKDPPQLIEVVRERRQRLGVGAVEHERDVGLRLGLRLLDPVAHQLQRPVLHLVRVRVRENPEPPQVAVVARDALVRDGVLDPLLVDVARRVVGRRMG